MYIENIKIGSFGKLSMREYNLTEGINLIEGRNESGKSTLCEFIKFVFYGLSNKGTDGEMSERKRHISWKTNDASGSIILNTSDNRYRIERSMVAHGTGYKDNITVVDLSNNSVVSGIKNPGEYFFGIPEDVFIGTVYIRQSEGAYFKGENISQAVENIFYSADESVNTEKALKKLDEARVQIKHKKNTGRGMLDELERERDELNFKLDEARRANELILQSEASLRNTVISIEKNKKDCEKMSSQMRKTEIFALLSKFGELKKYRDAAENYKKGKSEIISATTFNGFFPDEKYINELEKLKNQLDFLKGNVDSFNGNDNIGEEAEYSKELAELIKQEGGKDALLDKIYSLDTKKKRFITVSVILGVLAVAAAILGIFMGEKIGSGAAFLLIAGGLLASSCIAMLIFAFSAKGKITDIFNMFDADDEESLTAVITSIEESEKYELHRNEMLSYREYQRVEAQSKLNEGLDRAQAVLAKWGIELEEKSYSATVKAVDDVLSDISEITSNIALYDKEIEKNEAVASIIEAQISEYDEDTLREEFDSIDIEIDPENIGEIKKRYDFTVKAKDALTAKLTELEKTLAELKARTDRPSELESRLKIINDRIEELAYKHEAYVLAYEKLMSAGNTLRRKLAPGLSAAAGRLMGGLTDGKYKEIGVSDTLEMTYTFEDEGTVYTKTIDSVSSGTKDVAYISLRLALAELFSRSGEKMPVVFDEAFARLDNVRLVNCFEVVRRYSENSSQAIILTSQTREAGLLENSESIRKYNYIRI